MNWLEFEIASVDGGSRNGIATVQSRTPISTIPRGEAGRRALNIAVAVLGIVLAAPLMVLIAVLIRLTSRGPVLFQQQRVGLDRRAGGSGSRDGRPCRRSQDRGGRLFTICKFRTMYVGAEHGVQVWARPGDPRVTPVGRVLRKYRLDELPQLFNVLQGDMNVVGPRPEQPGIFLRLREEVDGYPARQKVLPGITGLAQIRRPYDRSVRDVKVKVRLDLHYMKRRSPATDARIMLETIPVMLARRGSL